MFLWQQSAGVNKESKPPYKTSHSQVIASSWGRSQVCAITSDDLGNWRPRFWSPDDLDTLVPLNNDRLRYTLSFEDSALHAVTLWQFNRIFPLITVWRVLQGDSLGLKSLLSATLRSYSLVSFCETLNFIVTNQSKLHIINLNSSRTVHCFLLGCSNNAQNLQISQVLGDQKARGIFHLLRSW